MSGEIRFESSLVDHHFDPPVSATRIIREKAVHTVRVGEEEKTSVEMSEWLHPEEQNRSTWWIPSLIAAIILLIILGIYFASNSSHGSTAGNQQKLTPATAPEPYISK
jgi:hypothetical protein